MYRLDLADPRLTLPVPVYQVKDKRNERGYLLRDGIEKTDMWNAIESIPFFAIEPEKSSSDLVPIYIVGNDQTVRLTKEPPDENALPLFYALPADGQASENSRVVSLYEYHHHKTGQCRYSTDSALLSDGWIRAKNPLCRVWKTPPEPILLDTKSKPLAAD